MPRDQVFISYSHEDSKWLKKLQTMLSPLVRNETISVWDDTMISVGGNWKEQIRNALAAAKVAVLLVSPHFLASDFIAKHELAPLLDAAKKDGLTIVWVRLSHCLHEETEIKDYQAPHDISKPLATLALAEQNRVLTGICQHIKNVAQSEPSRAGPKVALSNIRYSNPLFTGRDQVLTKIHDVLAQEGRAALSGLGGVGKTEIALEYAYQHSHEYAYILWATADSQEAIASDYAIIARLLKLPECDAKDQTLAVKAVTDWLSSHQGWLLILDNADELGMVGVFLPSRKNGHVLLTTRARAVTPIAQRVDIEKMGPEEGALFLLRRANVIVKDTPLEAVAEVDRASADEITTELGGLPLALDQAGAYIEETGCGLTGYRNRYKNHASELLRHRGGLATSHTSHPDPVATTWALSFQKVEQADPTAAELLNICAFLYPDGIPEELFSIGASELGPALEGFASDSCAFDRAVSWLLRYSLIYRDAGTLEIHRLVQEVLKQSMGKATERLYAKRAVRAVNQVFPSVEFSTWALCERLLAQAHACAELIKQWDFKLSEAAVLLNRAGYYVNERGRYSEAEPLYQRALTIREKALGPEHPDVATSLNNLAELYHRQGKYGKAEPLFERALAIWEKALGPDHPEVARSLQGLAVIYRRQGRNRDAEPFFKQALQICEASLGPKHPDVGWKLEYLAELYRDQDRYDPAESFFERARQIFKKALDPEHPVLARNLQGLAVLYTKQARYDEAERLFKEAQTILESAVGPEHPDVAWSFQGLAMVCSEQGQYVQAKPLFERALMIREKALGLIHPEVARSLQGLAELYRRLGRYGDAEPLFERALAIREQALGPEHPDVATSLNDLARLYRDRSRYEAAEPMEARARAILAKYA